MNASPPTLDARSTPPYWTRWPEIFAYPLQGAVVSAIIAFAVAHGVVDLLPYPVNLGIDLIVWGAFFRYGLEVLRWSANGRDAAPEISFTVASSAGRFAMLLLVLVELLLILITSRYGSRVALASGVAMMLATPAAVMILALDEALAHALNPFAWLGLALRLRGAYLILVAFFAAAITVQSLAAGVITRVAPGLLVLPLVFCIVNYLMIANFHLIGVVIHQYRDELGYAGHLQLGDPPPPPDPMLAVLEAARIRAATGDVRGATALLRDEAESRPDGVSLHFEYRRRLRQQGGSAELAAHARQFIPILLARQQNADAVDIAGESLQTEAAFTLDDADDISRLAAAAAEGGQHLVALALVAGFHERFPLHPDLLRNCLLGAKILSERLNRQADARALLRHAKYERPYDPAIAEVDDYLAFLERLSPTRRGL
ncbi:MAG TPA: hypothetical protein VIE67_04210 [Rudaea sp.]|uniref:hypothetical protein n=1 Tax=Rudaea sp. TaxID=2136325 RepID=UPI002F943E85